MWNCIKKRREKGTEKEMGRRNQYIYAASDQKIGIAITVAAAALKERGHVNLILYLQISPAGNTSLNESFANGAETRRRLQ